MRLTLFTDYTLRVLMYLGVHRDRLATIGEIAQAYDISRNHLMKVVHYLGQCGFLETVRGKGGGIQLGREPEDINIGDVVRQTEKDTVLVECFGSTPSSCRIVSTCSLKFVLKEAAEAFYEVLDKYTLRDLLDGQPQLRQTFDLIATSSA